MRRTSYVPVCCVLLALLLVAASIGLVRPVWSFALDVGAEGSLVNGGQAARFFNYYTLHGSEGWHADGRTFRWSDRRATLSVPYALRAGPLILELAACGCHPGEPRVAHLHLNGAATGVLPLVNQWRVYHVLVPTDRPHPEYGVLLDLRTPTTLATDGRALGVALDRIALRGVAPQPVAGVPTLLAVLTGVLLLAWNRRPFHTPLLVLLWLGAGLAYQPQLLPPELVAGLLVSGLVLLWRFSRGIMQTAVAAVVGVWLVLSMQVLGTWVVDDAYISFQYARNLLLGHGLVFNPGERVEGYTNFLWTVLSAGLLGLRLDPLLGTQVLTHALGFVLVVLAVSLARQMGGRGWVAGALLALSGPFLLYTARGSGMETGLFAVLVAATLLALVRHAWRVAGVLLALALLTRPDAAILAACAIGYALATGAQRVPGVRPAYALGFVSGQLLAPALPDLRPAVRLLLPVVILFGTYFVLRWAYYGALLPNTFYAKVDGSSDQAWRGLHYLWAFARLELLPLAGALGAAVALWRARGNAKRRGAIVLVAGFTLLFAAYIAAVGGDWVPGFRFGMPLIAPLAVLAACGLAPGRATIHEEHEEHEGRDRHSPSYSSWPSCPSWISKTGSLVLLAFALGMALRLPADSSFNTESGVWQQMERVRRFREIGEWLRQNTPPDALIAASAVGATPYFAERATIDVLGLTDAHIARAPRNERAAGLAGHERSDPEYVMARRPLIVTYYAAAYLNNHPALDTDYVRREEDGPEGAVVNVYVRK
jgi:arabinofuranosyltransferase